MKRFAVAAALLICSLAQAQAPDLSKMDLIEKSTPAGPVATVDGMPISDQDFLGLYRVQMAQLGSMAGATKMTDEIRLQTAIQCLRRLIRERILLSEAKKRGITVSDAEVQAEYSRQLQEMQKDYLEQTKQQLSEQQFLEKISKSREQVLADAKQDMIVEKTREALLQGKDTSIPDADVKKFYEKNPERFARPGGVHIKQVFVRPLGPSPKDWEAAEKRAREALGKVRTGTTFEAVARDYSDAPDKANGGHVMVASVENLPPFYQAPLKAMKPGDLSDIIKSDHGYHFFYYVESKEESKASLEEAEERIRGMLSRVKEEDIIDDFLRPIETGENRSHEIVVYLDLEKNLPASMRKSLESGGGGSAPAPAAEKKKTK